MGKHSKANAKNIYKNKQQLTHVELDAVPRKMANGEVAPTRVMIPDLSNAYGENKSIQQIAEDVVGKHSQDNKTAVAAGEKAREQLESVDFAAVRRQRAIARLRAKRPQVWMAEVTDNAGVLRGHKILFTSVDPVTHLEEVHEKFISIEESMAAR
jgi:hypothetical protein